MKNKIKYKKLRLSGIRLVSIESLKELGFREIFTEEENNLISLALQIQGYQLGEEKLPEGMDEQQVRNFMRAPILCQLAAKANQWYVQNGGNKKAIAGPFMVEGV